MPELKQRPTIITDVHGPSVRALAGAGDWAGLARYWIAHQSDAALKEAIAVVQRLADADETKAAGVRQNLRRLFRGQLTCGEGHLRTLKNFLEAIQISPFTCDDVLANSLVQRLAGTDRLTIGLLAVNSRAAWCQLAARAEPARQNELLQIGVDAARDAISLAVLLNDKALEAFFYSGLAVGLSKLGQMQCAIEAWNASALIYRQLATLDPDLYLSCLSRSLRQWAMVQFAVNDLGGARKNCEEALRILRNVAGATSEDLALHVGKTSAILGRIQIASNDLYNARSSLENALNVFNGLASSTDIQHVVAETLDHLGNVYRALNNLSDAKSCFEMALGILRQLSAGANRFYDSSIAKTLNDLGVVELALTDLNRAHACLEEALEFSRALARDHPGPHCAVVAEVLNNLGLVRFKLSQIDREDGLKHVLEMFTAPTIAEIEVASSGLSAIESANLAMRAAAMAALEEALAIWRRLSVQEPTVHQVGMLRTLVNLGAVHHNRGDWEDARTSLIEALAISRKLVERDADAHGPNLARVLNNFGYIQWALKDLQSARDCFSESVNIYRRLAEHFPTAFLEERIACNLNLGRLLRETETSLGWPLYPEACEALRQARDCVELFRGVFRDSAQRQRVHSDYAQVYELLACSCLDLWNLSVAAGEPASGLLREAMETAEASRAQLLMDLLVDEILRPNLPPSETDLFARWIETRRAFLQAARKLREAEANQPPENAGTASIGATRQAEHPSASAGGNAVIGAVIVSSQAPTNALRGLPNFSSDLPESKEPTSAPWRMALDLARSGFFHAQREQDEVLRLVRKFSPEFDPDRAVTPAHLEDVQALLLSSPETALVQFSVGHEASFAIIVTAVSATPVRLPELRWRSRELAEWFLEYYTRRAAPDDSKPHPTKEGALTDTWSESMPKVLARVAALAVQPVVDALAEHGFCDEALHSQWTVLQRGAAPSSALRSTEKTERAAMFSNRITRLVLSPHQQLHVFPLHACKMADGRYLCDAFEVSYTPSLSFWKLCMQRRRETPVTLLLTQNPTGDLPFSEVEGAAAVARFYPHSTVFDQSEARKAQLLKAAPQCHVWHSSGHSMFNPIQPLESAIVLETFPKKWNYDWPALPQWLTLRDTFTTLNLCRAELAILSGCESGTLRPEIGDNCVSLAIGFLYAGARCVVSALWAINDLSSALVISRFYELWDGGNGLAPAAALRESARWLREDVRDVGQLETEILPLLLDRITDARARERCAEAWQENVKTLPAQRPFASPAHWGPFIASGAAFRV